MFYTTGNGRHNPIHHWKIIKIFPINTICVHGHTPGALERLLAIRKEIDAQGVGIELIPLRRYP